MVVGWRAGAQTAFVSSFSCLCNEALQPFCCGMVWCHHFQSHLIAVLDLNLNFMFIFFPPCKLLTRLESALVTAECLYLMQWHPPKWETVDTPCVCGRGEYCSPTFETAQPCVSLSPKTLGEKERDKEVHRVACTLYTF